MKSNTKEKLLNYIKRAKGGSPHELANHLSISPQALHRQLKKLVAQGLLFRSGGPPKVFYSLNPMVIQHALGWAAVEKPEDLPDEIYCADRGAFQARADRALVSLQKTMDDDLAYLITAIIGEIGNNSYDHNLGNWRDLPGVLFSTDSAAKIIVLADRGQGVMATLKRIRPEISDHSEALRVAFSERLSGRSPEQRGNGLKFVRRIIEENDLGLEFYSGNAVCKISDKKMEIINSNEKILGTVAIITY